MFLSSSASLAIDHRRDDYQSAVRVSTYGEWTGPRDGRRRIGLAHPKNIGGRGDFVPTPSVLSRRGPEGSRVLLEYMPLRAPI